MNRISDSARPLPLGASLASSARREGDRATILWITYAIGYLAFGMLRRLADDTGVPWLHGYVIRIDRALGMGTMPTVILQRLWYTPGRPTALDGAAIGFHLSFYLVPWITLLILWLADRAVFTRYVVALVTTYLVGLLVYFAVPTMPPWMAGERGYAEPVARVLYDRIHAAWPGFYAFGRFMAGGNDVAAMPSLHMATTVLVTLGLSRLRRRVLPFGVAYSVGMGFSLLYTGEHYAADLLAGVLIAGVCWVRAPRVLARLLPEAGEGPLAEAS